MGVQVTHFTELLSSVALSSFTFKSLLPNCCTTPFSLKISQFESGDCTTLQFKINSEARLQNTAVAEGDASANNAFSSSTPTSKRGFTCFEFDRYIISQSAKTLDNFSFCRKNFSNSLFSVK